MPCILIPVNRSLIIGWYFFGLPSIKMAISWFGELSVTTGCGIALCGCCSKMRKPTVGDWGVILVYAAEPYEQWTPAGSRRHYGFQSSHWLMWCIHVLYIHGHMRLNVPLCVHECAHAQKHFQVLSPACEHAHTHTYICLCAPAELSAWKMFRDILTADLGKMQLSRCYWTAIPSNPSPHSQ